MQREIITAQLVLGCEVPQLDGWLYFLCSCTVWAGMPFYRVWL